MTASPMLLAGSFCDGLNRDVLYACNLDDASRAGLVKKGWTDVGGWGCVQRSTNNACTAATYAACSDRGLFCNTSNNHTIEYMCTCSAAPTPNWGPVGGGVLPPRYVRGVSLS